MDILFITVTNAFGDMLLRLLVCLIFSILLVDRLYYPKSHRRDFYFTFILISVAIFLLVYFMIFGMEDLKTKTSMGIGIGLFGIFSIMRYRTETMPVREMTYLFIIVSVAVVNAIAIALPVVELVCTEILVLLLTWACEHRFKPRHSKLIQYDRIALITPERREELLADLKARTGLDIMEVEVGAIDFLKDTAMLRVYYPNIGKTTNTINNKTKLKGEDLQNSF